MFVSVLYCIFCVKAYSKHVFVKREEPIRSSIMGCSILDQFLSFLLILLCLIRHNKRYIGVSRIDFNVECNKQSIKKKRVIDIIEIDYKYLMYVDC